MAHQSGLFRLDGDVAVVTGAGELFALKWQDIDLVAGQVVVRRTLWQDQEGPPKGGPQEVTATPSKGRPGPTPRGRSRPHLTSSDTA
jgi:integrase